MRIYCYKCHSLLQFVNGIKSIIEGVKEDVYECPRCKYKIVIWRKK